MPVDYANARIYCIRDHTQNGRIVYIGSTTRAVSQRMADHRQTMRDKPNIKIYQLMAKGGVVNFYAELVCNFPCNNREELLAEEGRHIRMHQTVADGGNTLVAGRSQRQNYIENHEVIREKAKENYAENIEAIRQRDRNRYAADKATFAARNLEYRQRNAEQLKAYADARKAQRAETNKAYHAAHRDEINARRAERRRLAAAGAVVVDA